MPLYKLVGNRILTKFENSVAGLDLTEWHSGYRAYSVAALKEIPFEQNSDGFAFDTEIILQLHEAGKRITEIPIPTYYGDEICYVNGMRYAGDVTRDVLRYRAHKIGLGSGEMAFATREYDLKQDAETSHQRIVRWLERRPPSRILDLGCADGRLGEMLRACGHDVTGVDVSKADGVGERLNSFIEANLEEGVPAEVGGDYDVVLAADILEHVRRPGRLLVQAQQALQPRGTVITSIPNFAHWYPRARVALGRFDYDRRGILDADHVRFFTRRSFERLAATSGLSVRRRETIGLPVEAFNRGAIAEGGHHTAMSAVGAIEHVAVAACPTLFGFQFLYELEPARDTARV
jgi:SAM-dependent methyltransferase